MKIKVSTVDDNTIQVELLKKYFDKDDKIEIINNCSDIKKSLKLLEELISNINESITIHEKKPEKKLTDLLHKLGMPSNIKGYYYVRSAILMVYENPDLIGSITKRLYPDLSVKFNTSTERIERAIRHAIQVSYDRGDINLMEEIFGNTISIDKDKPTNSEFIVTIADKLRLEVI